MKNSLLLRSALALALATPLMASAESQLVTGAGSATANLDLRVVIPRVLFLGVGMVASLELRPWLLALHRPLDDKAFALDHLEVKLLGLPATMQTRTGRLMAEERAEWMMSFRSRLLAEIG